jgi:large subunit ribosomal protein L20
MPRTKGGVVHARKRKRLMRRTKGFRHGFGKLYRPAKEFARKAGVYATVHRKQKKRSFRSLWISRLSAACRERGVRYSQLIPALQIAGIELNRKMLSEIAIADPTTFDAIIEQIKPHIPAPTAKAA